MAIRLVGPSAYQPKTVIHPPPPIEDRDDDPIDGGLVVVAWAILALPIFMAIVFTIWLVMR